MKRLTILTTMLPRFLLFVAERYKSNSNLVPRVSILPLHRASAPGGGKMRDPGNEVGTVFICCAYVLLPISAVKLNQGVTEVKQTVNNMFIPTSWIRFLL